MTLEELDVFLKERGIQVVGSIDSKTLFKEVLGIQEPSYQQTRQIEDSRSKITNLIQSSSEKLYQESSKLNYKNILSNVLGLPEESSNTSNFSLVKKEFLSKIEELSNEITKNVEDIKNKSKKISENIDDKSDIENKKENLNNTNSLENSNKNIQTNKEVPFENLKNSSIEDNLKVDVDYSKEKPITESKKSNEETTQENKKPSLDEPIKVTVDFPKEKPIIDSKKEEATQPQENKKPIIDSKKEEATKPQENKKPIIDSKKEEATQPQENKKPSLDEPIKVTVDFPKEKPIIDSKKDSTEIPKQPEKKDSNITEIKNKLDRITSLLSAEKLESFATESKNLEKNRIYQNKQTDLLQSIVETNKALLFSFNKYKQLTEDKFKQDEQDKKYSKTEGSSEGGILGFLGTLLVGALAPKILSLRKAFAPVWNIFSKIGRFAGKLLKLTGIFSLGAVALEAVYPLIQKVFSSITGTPVAENAKNPVTETLGMDEPGRRDTLFRTGIGVLALSNLRKLWKDPNRSKTITDLGRKINTKQSVPFTDIKGAGRARQAVGSGAAKAYEATKDVAKSGYQKAIGIFKGTTPAVELTKAQQIAKTTAENIQRVKAAQDAKLAAQAAKLVPEISKAATATTAVKEAGIISKALSGIKSFGSGVAGKIGKMAFGTVATGVLGGILKRIPIISGIYELYMAYKRYTEGDYKGMVLRLLSASSNLLYLLGPQMVFLQMPLSWWLSYLDESDQPTEKPFEDPNLESGDMSGNANVSTKGNSTPAIPDPTIPKNNNPATPKDTNKKPEKKLPTTNQLLTDEKAFFDAIMSEEKTDETGVPIESVEQPKKWVKLTPEPPKEPLSPVAVNPPVPVVQEQKETAPTQINAPTTNVINNNSTIKQTIDPVYQNRSYQPRKITARDYRY